MARHKSFAEMVAEVRQTPRPDREVRAGGYDRDGVVYAHGAVTWLDAL